MRRGYKRLVNPLQAAHGVLRERRPDSRAEERGNALSSAEGLIERREHGAKSRETTTEEQAKGGVAFKNCFEGKKFTPERMAKGGKVGKDSRRVLTEGLVREEGIQGQCRRRSHGDRTSMVLGVGENLLVRK